MRTKRWLLMVPALALAALPLARPQASYAAGCEGRYSWLVPSACTYCQWGGSCGGCTLSGCNQQRM